MARGISDDQHYADIAAAIRTKNETETLYKPSEMASAILAIQGGIELNFEVIGGTVQPESPKENTIWVNTDQEITGWSFSAEADKPETPDEGMLWFETTDVSDAKFNALKENAIQVYLLSSKQYIDGAWEPVDTKIYKSGEWVVSWDGVTLYSKGNQCEIVTGGWQETYQSEMIQVSPEFREDCIYINASTGYVCDLMATNQIDLTGINKIKISLKDAIFTDGAVSYVCLYIANNNNPPASHIVARTNITSTAGELNVSQYNGLYYVAISVGYPVECKIVEIKMER